MTTLEAVLFVIVLIFIFWCVQSERCQEPENEELVQARINHLDALAEAQQIENANELFKHGWLTKKAIDGLMLSFSFDGEEIYEHLYHAPGVPVLTPEKAA